MIIAYYHRLLFVFSLLLINSAVYADCAILLHGLARTHHSMSALAKTFEKRQYTVVNISYPSRYYSIEALADSVLPKALARCSEGQAIDIVTHSMGAILLRQYLSSNEIPKLRRVVMLGPPNQGSEVVDKLGAYPGFHWFNGDAGMQLGTGSDSLPNRLGAVDIDVGVIAGNKSVNLFLSLLIPGPDDGKVSVKKTHLAGANDHLVMPVTHTFMMANTTVINQVLYYVKYGHFKRDNSTSKLDHIK